jgi:hypothetical protein
LKRRLDEATLEKPSLLAALLPPFENHEGWGTHGVVMSARPKAWATRPFHEGIPQRAKTEVQYSSNETGLKRTRTAPRKCFIRFKKDKKSKKEKPSLNAVLLSIEDDSVSAQEDTSDKDQKTGEKQAEKNPLTLHKTDISSLQCKE